MVNEIKALTDKFENETHLKKRIQLALQISAYYRTHSKENLALEYMQTALEEAGQNDYKIGEGRTYKELSLLHYSKLALDKALEYSFQALTIFKTYGKNLDISEILCNIGVFYNAVNLDEKGKTYFLQSLKYNPNNIPPLINLGEYYVRHGETVTAIEYFKKTIAISQAQNKMGDLAYAYKSMGEAYNSLQRYDTAIDYFNKSLETLKGIDDEHTTAFAWLGMGISFMNKERIDLSLEYSFRALKLAKKLDNSELYWFSYNNLSMIYEKSEDYKNAFKYLNLGMKLQTKLYSRKLRRRIAELEAVYEIEKKDLETKRLLEKSARLASIGVMTAGITHEINQPLNSIVINSEGLLFKDNRDKVLPDLYRESIEKIFKSAQRIDQIIKHIRTYWNASDDLIKSTAVNVNDSINDALGFLNQQIQSHGIDLQTFFSFDNPVILGHKVHLEQIIVNLITNSIHALDKTGRESKLIKIATHVDKERVILNIEDNGTGLDQDASANIFDPFYSTKKPSEGMGLGLSIVKNYVNQMNGEIEFKNKKKAGVSFEIKFPILSEEK